MKTFTKLVLQKVLGFKNYLFIFSLFIIATLKRNKKEGDFLYFLSLLNENTVLLDVGANIGVMTVHMAKKFPQAQVFAYEPVPENYSTLQRVVGFFNLKNVTAFNFALGNSEGEIRFVMPEIKKVKFQGLSHIDDGRNLTDEAGQKYLVPMRKLDNLNELNSIDKPIGGIKIDVENYEYQVLAGGIRLISKYKPIIYAELWENQNRLDCMKLLTEIGYYVFILENGNLIRFEPGKHKTQNFFFIAG